MGVFGSAYLYVYVYKLGSVSVCVSGTVTLTVSLYFSVPLPISLSHYLSILFGFHCVWTRRRGLLSAPCALDEQHELEKRQHTDSEAV